MCLRSSVDKNSEFVVKQRETAPIDQYNRLSHELEERGSYNKDKETMRTSNTYTSSKKVDVSVYDSRIGLEKEALQRQRDLEFELSHSENQLKRISMDADELRTKLIPNLEAQISSLQRENSSLRMEITETVNEVNMLRQEKYEFSQRTSFLEEKTQEIGYLHSRIKELELLPNELALSREKIVSLTKELERLTTLMKHKERDYEYMSKSFKSIEVEKKNMKSIYTEFEALKVQYEESKNTIFTISKENDFLSEELRVRDSRIVELQAKLTEISRVPQEFKMQITELTKVSESLKLEISTMEKELTSRDHRIQELLLQIDQLRSSQPNMLKSLQNVSYERDSLISQLDQVESQVDPLIKEKNHYLELLRQRDFDLSTLTETLRKLNIEFESAESRIFFLEDKLKQTEFLISSRKDTELEIQTLTFEIEKLRKMIDSLTIERDQVLDLISNRDAQIVSLKKEVERFKADLRVKSSELSTISEEVIGIESLKKDIYARDQTIAELCRKLDEWKVKETTFTESMQMFTTEKNGLLVELDNLKAQLNQMMLERDRLSSAFGSKDKEIFALNERINKLNLENKELCTVLSEYETRFHEFEAVISQRDTEISQLSKRFSETTTEITTLRTKLQTPDPEFDRLRVLVRDQDREIVSLRSRLDELLKLEARIKELSLMNSQLQEKLQSIDSLRLEISRLRKYSDELVVERNSLVEGIRERDAEIAGFKSYTAEYQTLQVRYQDSLKEIERLNVLVSQSQVWVQERESLFVKIQEFEKSNELLVAENKRLMETNQSFSLKIKELEQSLTVTTTKYNQLESIYSSIRGAALELSNVHDKLVEVCDNSQIMESEIKNVSVMEKKSHIIDQSNVKHGYNLPAQRF